MIGALMLCIFFPFSDSLPLSRLPGGDGELISMCVCASVYGERERENDDQEGEGVVTP